MEAQRCRGESGCGLLLEGHKNTINSVDFSPDGRQLASGSLDQTARIWDATTGSSLAVMHGHPPELVAVQFASDGRRLLTPASEDHAIRLWETSDGALAGLAARPRGGRQIRLSRDGKFVGVADDRGTVRIWDLDRTMQQGVLGGHTSFVYDVAITVDGRWIASSSSGTKRSGSGIRVMAADQQSAAASVASSGRSLHRRLALGLPRSSERASLASWEAPRTNLSGAWIRGDA